ncbi:hypothetical protein AKJ09_08978 [Labilithrix luteola]|uniref:AbiJ-NTD3 domain-containing protein n=1 Tax=Labilithrix luteola TaxID=1391654 RepID=A0A0K1QA85_9BACT|nr:hypothetical protein [Labilithrix luteola]AKV02315.1 hypothetical protein AKJ09_08978 [Labilithrix luteola]
MDLQRLRSLLRDGIGDLKDLTTTPNLNEITDALGLPGPVEASSKRLRLHGAVDVAPEATLPDVARRFLEQYPPVVKLRDEVQEIIWSDPLTPRINKRVRRELATVIDKLGLFDNAKGLDRLLDSLFNIGPTLDEAFLGQPSLADHIARNVYNNPGQWSAEQLFEEVGALDCSDARFCRLLEGLASADVRPDVSDQRRIAQGLSEVLRTANGSLREVREKDGYPEFSVALIGAKPLPKPKNLIFASRSRPDLRFSSAVDNDVEVVSNVDDVLICDKEVDHRGIRWRDLQEWWAQREGLVETPDAAKETLYKRLLEILPSNSPPQVFLFKAFFRIFRAAVHDLPALLPEVLLHWDPKTARERGKDALTRQRMDFLMLLPHNVRVVLEVDGKQHYSEEDKPSPRLYATMVSADRDLRLGGYEVYRFGGYELDGSPQAIAMLTEFFGRLFRRHAVTLPQASQRAGD